MKERPILFSAPMVRAILEGRKTQTRRVVKPQPYDGGHFLRLHNCPAIPIEATECFEEYCPYGQNGDRLWVRETHNFGDGEMIEYRADGSKHFIHDNAGRRIGKELGNKWKPSIHMPRWASRITLEVVSIRVERLQDISEEDAKEEGTDPYSSALDIGVKDSPRIDAGPYQKGYALLWGEINGPGSWAANPWVWVVEFRRIEQ